MWPTRVRVVKPAAWSSAETRAETDSLGRALARGRRAGVVNVSDANLIDSRARAQAVQDDASFAFASPIEGFVLTATTTVCARLLNCETPVAAPMFVSERIEDGGDLDVTPTLLGIGVELQFRFGRAYPVAGDEPDRLDHVRRAIVGCHMGLQILGRRFGHGTPMNGWTALADFGLAAYHVRGRALAEWRDLDLRALDMSLFVDGNKLASGTGGDALDDPIAALSWLARSLASRGSCLEAGSFVSIGSCTGLTQLVPGHVYIGEFGTGQAVSVQTI